MIDSLWFIAISISDKACYSLSPMTTVIVLHAGADIAPYPPFLPDAILLARSNLIPDSYPHFITSPPFADILSFPILKK